MGRGRTFEPGVAVLAVALAVGLLTAPPAAAAPEDPLDPRPGRPNLPPRAVAEVSIAPRAIRSAENWSTMSDQYFGSYVNPTRWMVDLDACRSSGGTNPYGYQIDVRSYVWRLEPLDGQAGGVLTQRSARCRSRIELRQLGGWRVRLVTTGADGRSAAAADERRFRDVVIVAFGDSYVSGEGNPDERARWKHRPGRLAPELDRPAQWTDRQCHRSLHSWARRAASAYEDEDTAVTFLNYACSGSKVFGVVGTYKGIEPDGWLPAQVRAARRVLGDPVAPGTRMVHAVLMSIGVNDAKFSDMLLACAAIDSPLAADPILSDPCTTAGKTRYVRALIRRLRGEYDRLELALAANLKIGPSGVRFVEYPARLMTNGRDRHTGCGALSGISGSEARWVTRRGDELNRVMRRAAARWDWRYVGGVRDAFRGHGYCAGGRSWFRSLAGSLALQANHSGTAHPDLTGARTVARLVRRTLPSFEPVPPRPARVRFEVTRVRVTDPPVEGALPPRTTVPPRLAFGVNWYGSHHLPAERNRGIRIGRWVEVPEPGRTTVVETVGSAIGFSGGIILPAIRIPDDDAPKGFLSTGIRRLGFFVIHRRIDGWRPGTHRLVSSNNNATLEVEYRVSVQPYDVKL